jgi:hypothetical protein
VREDKDIRSDAFECEKRVKDIRGRKRAELTDEDHEYFARLRQELARGPKGMCDPLEYAPLDSTEQVIEELRQNLRAKIDKITGRGNATVHGSDIRRVGTSGEDTGSSPNQDTGRE